MIRLHRLLLRGLSLDSFEFDVDEKLRPSVERSLTGTTALDSKIAALPLPEKGMTARLAIHFLRIYRAFAPKKLRNRCVFEPSCSHYSEMAVREHGVIKGCSLTLSRLSRCKSGNGGIDLKGLNTRMK